MSSDDKAFLSKGFSGLFYEKSRVYAALRWLGTMLFHKRGAAEQKAVPSKAPSAVRVCVCVNSITSLCCGYVHMTYMQTLLVYLI